MPIDPRWTIVKTFAENMAAGKPLEVDGFAESFDKYASALESLAADETIPESERREAQFALDCMPPLTAAHRDLALKTLHRVARENGDETIRHQASEMLRAATERITPATKSKH